VAHGAAGHCSTPASAAPIHPSPSLPQLAPLFTHCSGRHGHGLRLLRERCAGGLGFYRCRLWQAPASLAVCAEVQRQARCAVSCLLLAHPCPCILSTHPCCPLHLPCPAARGSDQGGRRAHGHWRRLHGGLSGGHSSYCAVVHQLLFLRPACGDCQLVHLWRLPVQRVRKGCSAGRTPPLPAGLLDSNRLLTYTHTCLPRRSCAT